LDGGQNPDVLCRQNPDGSGIALLDNKERHDITKKSGHYEPVLKDARPKHGLRTEDCDLRSDSRVQELSSDNDCGLKDARAQHIFGTQEGDLRGDSRVQELSSDHNCGLKDASASFSVPKDASEPEMDGEGDAIGQKLHIEASRGIADQKIQRVSCIKLHLCNAGRNRCYRWVVNIDAIDRY
jgi:hypothetical protein